MSINNVDDNIKRLMETFNVKFLKYKSKQELKQMAQDDLVEYCIFLQNKITELENRMVEHRGYMTMPQANINNQGDIFCKTDINNQTDEQVYYEAEENTNKSNCFINKLFTNPLKFFRFHD